MSILSEIRGAIKFSVESPCALPGSKLSNGELYSMAVTEAISKINEAYCPYPENGPAYINNWLISDSRVLKCLENGRLMQIDITFQEGGSVECAESHVKFVKNGTKMTNKLPKAAKSKP